MLYFDAAQDRWYAHDFYYSSTDYEIRWQTDVQAGTYVHGYQLLLQGADGKYYPVTEGGSTGNTNKVSTVEFLVGGTMLYYDTSTDYAADAVISTNYLYTSKQVATMEYWNNRDSGWAVPYMPIYLVGRINSNGYFVLDNSSYTSFLTQDLPTTDDGKIYWQIGLMSDNYDDFRIVVEHPMYIFKDGVIKKYGGYAEFANNANLLDGKDSSAFALSSHNHSGVYQPAGTYNTIIGTDSDISTSGATIVGSLTMTDGVITAHSTRTLTLANLGYTGATNANYITNNNQLTNGAGYITSSALSTYATQAYVGTEIGKIVDAAPTTLNTLNELAAALGDDPNFATTIADSIGRKLDASVNPITGATVSNDTITFTKSDASTFAVSISDANTWRGIDDVPVNGQTAESISSNWAYDHTAASNPHGTTYSDVGAAAASHTHTIANVTGLQSALDGKQAKGEYATAAQGTKADTAYGWNPVVSATVSNDTTTFTKADGTTFALTTSDANSNTYVTGASFNTTDGVLTLTRNSGSVTVDLDGRYLQSVPVEYLTKTDGDKYYQPIGSYQPAGTYNTIIGTDTDINTSGSTIIDNIYVTDGVITSMGTRTLTLADLGYSGATNANYITNNNQLTNGAGYVTSSGNTIIGTDSDIDTSGYTVINTLSMTDGVIISHDTRHLENVKVTDTRAAQKTPNDYIDYGLSLDFTDKFTGLGAWWSGITVKGWTDGYAAWQLIGGSNTTARDEWYLRSGLNTTWNSMRRVWHDGNLNPIVSATVSNDTTTYTKADGSTFALTTSDANSNTYVTSASFNTADGVLTLTRNSGSVTVDLDGRYSTTDTNTWRPIHDSPVNGATTTSISSNWVYDNVRNFSSGGNSLTGSLTCTGDVIAYSDMRLKSNVETIDSALEKVEALRGVSYEKDGKKSVGVIAQEVADVIPEVVSQDGEYLGVAYGNLVGVLIEAVKELSAEVKELKSKLGE